MQPPGRRRPPLLLLLALVALALLLRRRRARAAAEQAAVAEPDPTVPAVPGHTSSTSPEPGPRLAQGVRVPGSPRLTPVLGGSVPHEQAEKAASTVLRLPAGRYVVGRDASADVRLADPTVSLRHALLEVEDDGAVHVRDLGALNGLAVDGVPVVRAALHDGNRLSLGESALVFRCDPPDDDGGRQGGELGEQPHHREQGRD